jgi:hypothetical protein
MIASNMIPDTKALEEHAAYIFNVEGNGSNM